MPYKAHTIAKWFLRRARDEGEYLTQMKLQKLVYIAHGWNLGLDGGPLIEEQVEAWQYGPVVRDLYERYLSYGSQPVTEFDDEPVVAAEDAELLEWVWNRYKKFTAGQLSTITHQNDTPWSQSYSVTAKEKIDNSVIEGHYKKLLHQTQKNG